MTKLDHPNLLIRSEGNWLGISIGLSKRNKIKLRRTGKFLISSKTEMYYQVKMNYSSKHKNLTEILANLFHKHME